MTDRRLSEDHPRDPHATPWPEMRASFEFTPAEEQQVAEHAERMRGEVEAARLAEIRAYTGFLSAIGPDTEGGRLGWLLARVDQLTAERDQAHRDCQSYADLASGAERTRQFHKADADRYEEELRQERDQYAARVPLVCSDERHDAKVRGLQAAIARVRAHCTLLAEGSCRVAARETAMDVLRLLNGDAPSAPPEPPPGDTEQALRRVRELDAAGQPLSYRRRPRPDSGWTWNRNGVQRNGGGGEQ